MFLVWKKWVFLLDHIDMARHWKYRSTVPIRTGWSIGFWEKETLLREKQGQEIVAFYNTSTNQPTIKDLIGPDRLAILQAESSHILVTP